MTTDCVIEYSKIFQEESLNDDKYEWNNRFQSIQDKIRSNPSTSNIDQLISLSRDFNHAAKMYGQIIISEKFLPVHRKTLKVKSIKISIIF